ncbi:MAG: DsbA family oxidoreductase [Lysobacterales bacterium]
MTVPIKIDFVSDVSCPWCVIGLLALEQALARAGDVVSADIHIQPFELNPQMPPEGQDIAEHLTRKYGSTPAQLASNAEAIRARGEALGFEFRMDKRTRVYNTFDAHRLLHWASLEGRALPLKHALLRAYFTDGENPGNQETLARRAGAVGLDVGRAREVLSSGEYAEAVRQQQLFYTQRGIHAVPAVIINDRHLISGGQPVETFEHALRQFAAAA